MRNLPIYGWISQYTHSWDVSAQNPDVMLWEAQSTWHIQTTCRHPSQQSASSAGHVSELVWTFSPAESSDDSCPSLHLIIATWEPPKWRLPSWAQSTYRTIKDDKVPISLKNVPDEPIKTNFIKSWPLSTCLLNILCNKTGVIWLSRIKGFSQLFELQAKIAIFFMKHKFYLKEKMNKQIIII